MKMNNTTEQLQYISGLLERTISIKEKDILYHNYNDEVTILMNVGQLKFLYNIIAGLLRKEYSKQDPREWPDEVLYGERDTFKDLFKDMMKDKTNVIPKN